MPSGVGKRVQMRCGSAPCCAELTGLGEGLIRESRGGDVLLSPPPQEEVSGSPGPPAI